MVQRYEIIVNGVLRKEKLFVFLPTIMCFHPLTADIEPPERLNNPFYYEPHPLCRVAAQQVRAYVESQPELLLDAQKDKMLGVLVVSDSSHSSYSSHSFFHFVCSVGFSILIEYHREQVGHDG
jgi:hypothetical protein